MRAFWFLVAIATLLLSGLSARAADKLDGRYLGIDDAKGASIEITADEEGYTGTFFDKHGNKQEFEADAIDNVATAVLDMDGRTVLLRMVPLPYGAQVTLVPFDAEGRLVTSSSLLLAFVREGVRLPKMPKGFTVAPRSNCTRVAAFSFLVSYEFWDPAGVRDGYRCLPERARTLMQMFPAVRVDVIWKICLSSNNRSVLARALRGTSVSCGQVLDAVATMQRNGRFAAYKKEVELERDSLAMSIRCADGYPETRGNCERAARFLAKKAQELTGPAEVLKRFR